MTQVKKFRAATTREALEKIKYELGEEAFVLETRRVRSKGFLGFGGQNQIEISAATPESLLLDKDEKKTPKTNLRLVEDDLASPSNGKTKLVSALNERASSAEKFEKILQVAPKNLERKIETVEISTNAPKIIHPRKDVEKSPYLPKKVKPISEAKEVFANNVSGELSNREVAILRSELRELKFSLNALSARRQIETTSNVLDFDRYSELFDSPFYDAYLDLATSGISPEKARQYVANVIPQYKAGLIKTIDEVKQAAIKKVLDSTVNFDEDPLEQGKPSILAFIGSTGVGKTTTIAKLAARIALHERRKVELITLDTYRIAAVEQLKTYAEIIGAGCQIVRSVLELETILHRLPADTVALIDTTGRSPHDLADQFELSDFLRSRKEIRKCLAVQATTNISDSLASIERFTAYGADCFALTKMDETTRPGALLELASQSSLPLVYLCTGQRVPEDLALATPENLTARIFGKQL